MIELSSESLELFLVTKKQYDECSLKINILVLKLTEQLRKDKPDVSVFEVCELLETFEITPTEST